MLYPNGQRVLTYPGRHVAGSLAASGALAYGGIQGARFNRFVSNTYSPIVGAVPSGYLARAYILPITSGGISGFSDLSITSSGAGVLGLPGTGSASLTFDVADAAGQLISSGSGAASLTFTFADALLVASLGGTGSAAMSITTTALLGARASLTASGSFSITGTLTPYAIGQMQGSTVDNTVLTVDAITAALIAAAMANPIHANIKRVNDVSVSGTGAAGDEWGPA